MKMTILPRLSNSGISRCWFCLLNPDLLEYQLTIYKKDHFNFINILKLRNDLEKVVFKYHPKLKQVKSFMEVLPNIQFVRMTGSGSSLLGYFLSKNSAINGAKLFKKKYKNYWCIVSKTI